MYIFYIDYIIYMFTYTCLCDFGLLIIAYYSHIYAYILCVCVYLMLELKQDGNMEINYLAISSFMEGGHLETVTKNFCLFKILMTYCYSDCQIVLIFAKCLFILNIPWFVDVYWFHLNLAFLITTVFLKINYYWTNGKSTFIF